MSTTYLLLGRNMDSLMNTEPERSIYQQVPISSGLEKEKENRNQMIIHSNNICMFVCMHSADGTAIHAAAHTVTKGASIQHSWNTLPYVSKVFLNTIITKTQLKTLTGLFKYF